MTMGELHYKLEKEKDAHMKTREELDEIKRLWSESLSREYRLMKFMNERWEVFHS